MPYLAAIGSDGTYRVDVFDSTDYSFDYNFHVFDGFMANQHVYLDYQEHQNSGMDWFNNPINVHGGTYGIDLFFTELENSIGGNIYVNHQNAEGGFLELLTYDYDYDYYYYYGEDSLYFENYTYINQDGSVSYTHLTLPTTPYV